MSLYPANVEDSSGQIRIEGEIEFPSTQPAISSSAAYVHVQTTNPSTTFIAPLVFNSTASTGGLYAWDGSAYQQVGLATS